MLGKGLGADLKIAGSQINSELFGERSASYLIVSGELIPASFVAGLAGTELVLEEMGDIRAGEGIRINSSIAVIPRVWDGPLS
jgi:hypothetical protein